MHVELLDRIGRDQVQELLHIDSSHEKWLSLLLYSQVSSCLDSDISVEHQVLSQGALFRGGVIFYQIHPASLAWVYTQTQKFSFHLREGRSYHLLHHLYQIIRELLKVSRCSLFWNLLLKSLWRDWWMKRQSFLDPDTHNHLQTSFLRELHYHHRASVHDILSKGSNVSRWWLLANFSKEIGSDSKCHSAQICTLLLLSWTVYCLIQQW